MRLPSWEDEFGNSHWRDPSVDDKMARQSLLVLQCAMKGHRIPAEARKSAEFVAAHKAWPIVRNENVTINVLRIEDIEKAKLKAGLIKEIPDKA